MSVLLISSWLSWILLVLLGSLELGASRLESYPEGLEGHHSFQRRDKREAVVGHGYIYQQPSIPFNYPKDECPRWECLRDRRGRCGRECDGIRECERKECLDSENVNCGRECERFGRDRECGMEECLDPRRRESCGRECEKFPRDRKRECGREECEDAEISRMCGSECERFARDRQCGREECLDERFRRTCGDECEQFSNDRERERECGREECMDSERNGQCGRECDRYKEPDLEKEEAQRRIEELEKQIAEKEEEYVRREEVIRRMYEELERQKAEDEEKRQNYLDEILMQYRNMAEYDLEHFADVLKENQRMQDEERKKKLEELEKEGERQFRVTEEREEIVTKGDGQSVVMRSSSSRVAGEKDVGEAARGLSGGQRVTEEFRSSRTQAGGGGAGAAGRSSSFSSSSRSSSSSSGSASRGGVAGGAGGSRSSSSSFRSSSSSSSGGPGGGSRRSSSSSRSSGGSSRSGGGGGARSISGSSPAQFAVKPAAGFRGSSYSDRNTKQGFYSDDYKVIKVKRVVPGSYSQQPSSNRQVVVRYVNQNLNYLPNQRPLS